MLKPIFSSSKTISVNGKDATITVTKYAGKVRHRDPVTLKFLGWKQSTRIEAKCDLYPCGIWWPYNDFGRHTISGKFEGWELNNAEFDEIEKTVKEMLFNVMGWSI